MKAFSYNIESLGFIIIVQPTGFISEYPWVLILEDSNDDQFYINFNCYKDNKKLIVRKIIRNYNIYVKELERSEK